MIEAFIDLDSSLKLMLTSRNHVILYDTLQYNSLTLDKLYKILSFFNPTSVLVVTHAVYDVATYEDAYSVWTEQVGDNIYHGAVSQLDINKLMCVFNAAKIADIKFYDKMHMYQHFLGEQQCLIDNNNGMYLIVAKNQGLSCISYAKRKTVDQALLQVCRKTDIQDIKNFTTFIDYDCVHWFENYGSVLELPIYVQMTVFGFFRFIKPEVCFDANKIKFNSKLETVNYNNLSNTLHEPLVAQVAGQPKGEEFTVAQQDNVARKQIKQPKKHVAKLKHTPNERRFTDVAINVAICAIALVTLVAFAVGYYYKRVNTRVTQEALLSMDDLNHKELYLSKIQATPPSECAGVLEALCAAHPDYTIIGSVTMDDTIDVMYYMVDGNTSDELVEMLSEKFKVNAIVDGGIITLNNQNYKKFSVSLSKQ